MNTEMELDEQQARGKKKKKGGEKKGKEKVVNSCLLYVFPPAAGMLSFESWHSFEQHSQ